MNKLGILNGVAWNLSLFDQILKFIAQDNRNNGGVKMMRNILKFLLFQSFGLRSLLSEVPNFESKRFSFF